MERSVERWSKCDPESMAKQSDAAIAYAFEAAKKDILKMALILRIAAYPRRGTDEETLTVFDIAEMIQNKFSLDDLQDTE